MSFSLYHSNLKVVWYKFICTLFLAHWGDWVTLRSHVFLLLKQHGKKKKNSMETREILYLGTTYIADDGDTG